MQDDVKVIPHINESFIELAKQEDGSLLQEEAGAQVENSHCYVY